MQETTTDVLALQDTLYDSGNPTRRALHRDRRDWIERHLDHYATPETRALEVGPGCGTYLRYLAPRCAEVLATDIEPAFLARARQLASLYPNIATRSDDITRSALDAGSVDLLLCTEVIEHLPDSVPALREMARLISPRGHIVLSTPQRYSTLEQIARVALLPGFIHLTRAIYREPVLPTGHINLLTRKALARQIAGAGLVVCEAHLCGLYLPGLAEFGGHRGAKIQSRFERRLRTTPLKGLLWTQCYVLRRR